MQYLPMLDLKSEYEYMKTEIDSAISRCLDHQKWIMGSEVKELEELLAEYLNVQRNRDTVKYVTCRHVSFAFFIRHPPMRWCGC